MPLYPFADEGMEQTATHSTTRETVMPTLIQFIKSRTILFALVLAVLSVLQGYVGLLPLTQVEQMSVGIAVSMVITVLCIITTTPISEK